MDEVLRLQRVEFQVIATHMVPVEKRLVGAVDIRRGAAHRDRRIFRHIVTLPDQAAQPVEVFSAHNGGRSAAQADRFHAAVGKLLPVRRELLRQGQRIAANQIRFSGLDEASSDEGRPACAEGDVQLHDD